MRSIISIFLIFTIIYTTIGVQINAHYCEVTDVTSYALFEDEDCCSKSEKTCSFHQEKDDCCTDEINLVHLGQDVHFYPDVITPKLDILSFSYVGFTYQTAIINQTQAKPTVGRAPPLLKRQENRQALHQVFII